MPLAPTAVPLLPGTEHPLQLREPDAAMLPGFVAALEAGWSPNSQHDTSRRTLRMVRRSPATFLQRCRGRDIRVMRLGQGNLLALPPLLERMLRQPPRRSFMLRTCHFWLWDGEFCGVCSLRWRPDDQDLPAELMGHLGYAIVPWKRRRRYASRALGMLLQLARQEGLSSVSAVCDTHNAGSIGVIAANGGVFETTLVTPVNPLARQLRFAFPLQATPDRLPWLPAAQGRSVSVGASP
ncbi:GNAT family N-acetyltransferase [Rhodovastum atsumiense]|uniref:GNAT family N-acetyltransferase n=1 Tax=Rhodovastum atsumiense TaxID=504468 RepID=A0A5M6IKE8_9PROT|nr:GNAT family N-acetyltransferase [Rhodovastum atsumiense]KAA5608720.1 GNAT family N-acetyltransferase [Rhodovastum atsumiense]CAH2604968.1 GNAT family N-acetyltransferase [Rhodovastum atsumiense]